MGGIGRLAWLGAISALGVGCNQFIGLEEVSLAGDAGADSAVVVDAAVDAPPDAAVDAPPRDVFVFVTNQRQDGAFGDGTGGRVSADARCEDKYQLDLSDLGCMDIHAVIQVDDTLDTLNRMDLNFPIPQDTQVLRATDNTPVAMDWDALVDPNQQLLAPVSTSGLPVLFWSGRNADCTNWTATAGSGTVGDATQTSTAWLAQGGVACTDGDQKLLCVCW